MLGSMKAAAITKWVTLLEQAHELVRGVRDRNTGGAVEHMSTRALGAIRDLHERMVRAEIRALFAKTTS